MTIADINRDHEGEARAWGEAEAAGRALVDSLTRLEAELEDMLFDVVEDLLFDANPPPHGRH